MEEADNMFELVMKQIVALVTEQDRGLRDFGDTRKKTSSLGVRAGQGGGEEKRESGRSLEQGFSNVEEHLRSHIEHLAEGDTSAKEH